MKKNKAKILELTAELIYISKILKNEIDVIDLLENDFKHYDQEEIQNVISLIIRKRKTFIVERGKYITSPINTFEISKKYTDFAGNYDVKKGETHLVVQNINFNEKYVDVVVRDITADKRNNIAFKIKFSDFPITTLFKQNNIEYAIKKDDLG